MRYLTISAGLVVHIGTITVSLERARERRTSKQNDEAERKHSHLSTSLLSSHPTLFTHTHTHEHTNTDAHTHAHTHLGRTGSACLAKISAGKSPPTLNAGAVTVRLLQEQVRSKRTFYESVGELGAVFPALSGQAMLHSRRQLGPPKDCKKRVVAGKRKCRAGHCPLPQLGSTAESGAMKL